MLGLLRDTILESRTAELPPNPSIDLDPIARTPLATKPDPSLLSKEGIVACESLSTSLPPPTTVACNSLPRSSLPMKPTAARTQANDQHEEYHVYGPGNHYAPHRYEAHSPTELLHDQRREPLPHPPLVHSKPPTVHKLRKLSTRVHDTTRQVAIQQEVHQLHNRVEDLHHRHHHRHHVVEHLTDKAVQRGVKRKITVESEKRDGLANENSDYSAGVQSQGAAAEQQAGVSSTELTFQNLKTQQQQPQQNNNKNNNKKKRLSGLEFFKNLEKNNDGPEKEKQAGLSPVKVKIKTTAEPKIEQQKPKRLDKTDKIEKNNKIDRYLIKQQNPQQTGMSLREKIAKFSSKSPPKLPPNGEKTGTKPKPSQKTQENRQKTTTNNVQNQQQPWRQHWRQQQQQENLQRNQHQQQDQMEEKKKQQTESEATTTTTTGSRETITTTTMGQTTQQHEQQNSRKNEQTANVRTTTTLMEIIRNKNKQQENNKTKQQQNNNKNKNSKAKTTTTKPTSGVKKTIADKKDHPSTDIRLFLAQKNFEIEARAAANRIPPTQVRDSIQPSRIKTSARSESEAVRGDNTRQPNQMTLTRGEEQI